MTHLAKNRVVIDIEPHCIPYGDPLGNPQPDTIPGNIREFRL